ncbi:toll-like receptor 4 [Dreissena polymorpha]|nr:toll-like receptor 4 [Dreissena polymorpha]
MTGVFITPSEEYPDYCDMKQITDNTLANLVHVSNLSIVHCGLLSISKNAFKTMVKLIQLDLSQNYELTIEKAAISFTSLPHGIQSLYLDSVQTTNSLGCDINITKTMAASLTNTSLKFLSLDDNRIHSVELEAIFKLPKSLEHLRLRRNKFELGFYIFYAYQLTNLKKIDISYNFFGHEFNLWRHTNSRSTSFNDPNLLMTNEEIVKSDAKLDNFDCPKPQKFIPTISVTGFLPPRLERIDISHSKIGYPIYDFYIDTNNSLRYFFGAYSLLYCWAGPVHGVENVEEVDLSNNFCSIVKTDFFKSMPRVKRLYLQRNNLFYAVENKKLFHSNFEIEIINLSVNRISRLHPLLFANQTKMKKINLANNNLIAFDNRISHMKSLELLDMSNNHMYTLTKELRSDLDNIASTRKNGSLTLNLRKNVIACSCENLEVLEWILDRIKPSNNLLAVNISECYFTPNRSSSLPNATLIHSKNDLQFQVNYLQNFCASYTALIVVLVVIIFLSINIIVGGLVHRFRWKIRYWYYVSMNKRNGYMSLNNTSEHDIYLVYDEHVQEFVLDTLKPKLNEVHYEVFTYNDIKSGCSINDAVINAIHDSKVVVFVVSKLCNNDPEWECAVEMTEIESVKRGHSIGIVIFYNSGCTQNLPKSLRSLSQDSFIDYPEHSSIEEIDAFWKDFQLKINKIESFEDKQL